MTRKKTAWQKANPPALELEHQGGLFLVVTGDMAKVRHEIKRYEAAWLIRSLAAYFLE